MQIARGTLQGEGGQCWSWNCNWNLPVLVHAFLALALASFRLCHLVLQCTLVGVAESPSSVNGFETRSAPGATWLLFPGTVEGMSEGWGREVKDFLVIPVGKNMTRFGECVWSAAPRDRLCRRDDQGV